MKHVKFCFLIFAFFTGCSSLSHKEEVMISPKLLAVKSSLVAVLPFNNASTDISAEKFLRDMVSKKFLEKGWSIIPNDTVDEKLMEMGISDGGQLAAFKYQDLSSKLGARILCYGYIEDFKFQNLGYIVKKKVSLNIKLIDAFSGELLLETSGIGSDTKIHINKKEAQKAFVSENVVKIAGNILKKPLMKESEKAVEEIFKKIP